MAFDSRTKKYTEDSIFQTVWLYNSSIKYSKCLQIHVYLFLCKLYITQTIKLKEGISMI